MYLHATCKSCKIVEIKKIVCSIKEKKKVYFVINYMISHFNNFYFIRRILISVALICFLSFFDIDIF